MARKPIVVSEEQALYFRARRGHLAGPGAASAAEAAASILGAQSQQLTTGLLAVAQRTAGRPSAEELRTALFEERRLVRTWGQRDTVHLYRPEDWRLIVAARAQWAPGGRGGPLPPKRAVDRVLDELRRAERPLTRADVEELVPSSYLEAIAERAAMAALEVRRFAAGRLLWQLNNRGDACIADKVGRDGAAAEQGYASREHWFPDLEWSDPDPREAAVALARRYLAVNAPANVQDLAHFWGARIAVVREWIETLESRGELAPVRCGERSGLLALLEDAEELQRAPPRGVCDWPVRLLPMWDSLLMSHADKGWTVPAEGERPLIWRKAAMVSAVVLARGRVVATWTQKKRAKRLEISLHPLRGWTKRLEPGLRREAAAVAEHQGIDRAEVLWGS